MNEYEIALYGAICEVDPKCECPLVSYTPNNWRDTAESACDGFICRELAQSAIENHLHTLYEQWTPQPFQSVRITVMGGCGPDCKSWMTSNRDTTRYYCGPSKLRALLVAHAMKLNVPVPKEITSTDDQMIAQNNSSLQQKAWDDWWNWLNPPQSGFSLTEHPMQVVARAAFNEGWISALRQWTTLW